MKKMAFVFGALIMGFMMVSCGESTDQKTKKAADEFFTQAEKEVQAIDNAEDFFAFLEDLEARKDQLAETLFSSYETDNEGNFLMPKEVNDYVFNRATAYNNVEAAKAAEFITPALDDLESTVNQLYDQYQATGDLELESVAAFDQAYGAMLPYFDYDNILPELSDRYAVVVEKIEEMNDLLMKKLDIIYGE